MLMLKHMGIGVHMDVQMVCVWMELCTHQPTGMGLVVI